MPTTLLQPDPTPVLTPVLSRQTCRIRFSREDCERLEKSGFLTQRYQLIDGDILLRMAQHRPHVLTLFEVVDCLVRLFGNDYTQTQMPIEVSPDNQKYNYPEPDIAVLKQPRKTYRNAAPAPEEIRLLVEISDSTLTDDLVKKATLYATSGVAYYWIVDRDNRKLFVHSEPRDGVYTVTEHTPGETVSVGETGETLAVSELFPELD